MRKHVLLVGMAGAMTPDAVEKLKAQLARDLVNREIHIIQNALYIHEVIVDVERSQKKRFLIVGMGIHMTKELADETREIIQAWLPDHEIRFIVGGFCSAEVAIDVEQVETNMNGYL